jgi:glutathione S-transferase
MSPYSEKLRLAMGLRGVAWSSIRVSPQPPRDALNQLLGGYRRIPVLQRGAHFYCDTRLAFESLYDSDSTVTHLNADDEALRDWAEREIFFAVFSVVSPIKVLGFLARQVGLLGVGRFMRDRARMMRNATLDVLTPERARKAVQEFIEHLAVRLSSSPYLSGATPGYLDLCCYHPLWMARQIDPRVTSAWPPTVSQWMTRMEAPGHGEVYPTDWDRVFQGIAESQSPFTGSVTKPYQMGECVAVAPSDYARDETSGELTSLDKDRIVISRTLGSGQVIYLHFPRKGFELRRLQ